jgi:SAM-dependent methyltransferase
MLESLATWAPSAWGHRAQPPLPHTDTSWLQNWLTDLPPGPVLVLGCATGLEAALLAADDREVWALDAAPLLVAFGHGLGTSAPLPLPWRPDALRVRTRQAQLADDERRALQRLNWVIGDAMDPPFKAESFATIVMFNLIDAVPKPLILLGQAEALLQPGGVLLLSSPCHFQRAVTPGLSQLAAHLPADRALHEAMANLVTGKILPGFLDTLRLARSAVDVPWTIPVHPGFSASYQLHLMRLHKHLASSTL